MVFSGLQGISILSLEEGSVAEGAIGIHEYLTSFLNYDEIATHTIYREVVSLTAFAYTMLDLEHRQGHVSI